MVVNRLDLAEISPEMYAKAIGEGLHSFCDVPLISKSRMLGVLAVAKREENAFDSDEVSFLIQVANQVAIAVENALAYGKIAELTDRLAQENLYLQDEIRGEMDFEGIVGNRGAKLSSSPRFESGRDGSSERFHGIAVRGNRDGKGIDCSRHP